jgi:hypothetical protein
VTSQAIRRRLAWFVVAVIAGHHVGTVFGPLGGAGDTRWADWIDLVVPFLVLGAAAATLAAAGPGRREWVLLGVCGVLYTQGHGIHLAANSIANVEPSDVVHLWDETVGHWIWYVGLAGIVGTLALAVADVPSSRNAWSVALALAYGATMFTNSIEGGTVALGFVTSVVFIAWGWRRRGRLPELLVPAYGLALACLIGWGLYWGGFPQFSELGWI